jgi:hypothetical protein
MEVKAFPSELASQTSTWLSFLAALLVLTSVLWQHVAVVAASMAAQSLCNGAVKTKVGTVAMTLGWTGCGLSILLFAGLLSLISAIKRLDRSTD